MILLTADLTLANLFNLDLAGPVFNFLEELDEAETSPKMLLEFTDTFLELLYDRHFLVVIVDFLPEIKSNIGKQFLKRW